MISKRRIYEILDGAVRDRASKICEITIILVVVVNVFAVILDSVPSIHEEYKIFFKKFSLRLSLNSNLTFSLVTSAKALEIDIKIMKKNIKN